ncbi:MAG: dynamin family protein, partial [Rhodocyclales bacterium]|nr:dynamin family protein [Rhodocyclales bacterium]
MPASHQSEDILLRINSLNTLIQKYVSQIRSLDVNWDRAAHDAGLMTETELRNKLQTPSPQLRIGVIGRVKAGKSSLLNGLLFNGEEVLPKAATPMTAALTILTYGEHFQAEVDFYDDKELADIKRLHSQYEAKFAEELALLKKEQTAPPKTAPLGRHPNHLARNGNQINRAKSPDALQRQVKLKMDQDVHLSGAYVLYEDMRSAGLSSAPRGQKKLSARNLDELQNMLHDYVGASGSFTPWTKSLCIRLPYESLRNLEIVDTPGVNDPV